MTDGKEHGPDAGEVQMDELDREILAEDELEERRRRGMVFLPNALTTGAMFFGFYAIISAISREFTHATWALVAAGVLDLLDGRVARMVKGASEFGREYDSLSDLIAFGFAPAIIAYYWALEGFGNLGWGTAFLFLACAAIRLAKFNTLAGEEESKKYFRGLPSPIAAGLVIVIIMMHISYNPELYEQGGGLPPGSIARWGMLIWVILLALLMISNVRFRTLKDVKLTKYGPWLPLAGFAGLIAVFMSRPALTLFCAALLYFFTGVVEGGVIIRRREKEIREKRKEARRKRRTMRKLERARSRQRKREAKRFKKESSQP